MYSQKELMSPPELGQLNHLGKLAEQLALTRKVEDFLSMGGEITIEKSAARWSTVDELMDTGYRLSEPPNRFKA